MMRISPQLLQQMLAQRQQGQPFRPPLGTPGFGDGKQYGGPQGQMPGMPPQLPPGQMQGQQPQMPGMPPQFPGMPPQAPQQPGTFNPLPFEGGLGGLPKTGPRKGLGAGFGIGHFGPQAFVPGKGSIRGQQY